MSSVLIYKTVSLITGVIGILAIIVVLLIFASNTPDSQTVIPVGVVAVILLPVAYVTNKLGKRAA